MVQLSVEQVVEIIDSPDLIDGELLFYFVSYRNRDGRTDNTVWKYKDDKLKVESIRRTYPAHTYYEESVQILTKRFVVGLLYRANDIYTNITSRHIQTKPKQTKEKAMELPSEKFNILVAKIKDNSNWFDEFMALVVEYYKTNTCGGSLRVVLENGNLEDRHVDFSCGLSLGRGDEDGSRIANLMREMSYQQRERVYECLTYLI